MTALMISIRQINRSKHDILVRSRIGFITRSFTQPHLDIRSTVRHQMRKLCVLAGPSVEDELEGLTISVGTRTAGARRDDEYLGGRDSVLDEKRLVGFVVDCGGDI